MTTAVATTTWTIDPVHSSAEFAVRHMMVSTVKGQFTKLEGTIEADEANPLASSVTASIDVASIDTRNADRDAHLRSADFFDAQQFPAITFASTRIERVDAENYRLVGDLTIRGVTREVVLDTEFEGQILDPYGNQRAGFTATTQINRKDFGVNWNGAIEAGGVVVSDKVKITLHVEAIRPS
jgi:polyisoprenoid-binding protein YceI